MTDDFLTERSKGFTVNTYHDVPLIADTNLRDLNNRELRRQAIWAVRHPNKKMPNSCIELYSAFDEYLMAFPGWRPWACLLPKDKEEKE